MSIKPVFNPALPFEVVVKPPFNPDYPFVVDKKPDFDPKKPFTPSLLGDVKKEEVKTLTKEDVLGIIKSVVSSLKVPEKVIEKQVIHEKPAEIKTEVIREVFKKDEELVKEIESLKETLQRLIDTTPMPGGSGVIGIPPPEPNPDNYVLTVEKGKAKWKAGSSGGSLTPGSYTLSNDSTDRTFDASNYTMDELANLVSTIIRDLGGA